MAKSIKILSSEIINNFKDALKQNNKSLINELITKENVLKSDNNGTTLLHIVAKQGTCEIAQQLLEFGANLQAQDNNKQIPIYFAIENSPKMMKLLLNNEKMENFHLLYRALLFGNVEIVTIVINALPKIHQFNNDEENLSIEQLINKLLHHNIHLSNIEFTYPILIFFAAKIANIFLLQLILNNCRIFLQKTHLNYKACLALVKIEKYPKEQYEREINYHDLHDRTALFYAINQENVNAINFLLKNGLDPNKCQRFPNNKFYKPLHYTSLFVKNEEISQLLIRYGADVNATFFYNTNPIELITQTINVNYFNSTILKKFLSKSIDINTKDFNGMTSILIASKAGNLELIKILIEFNANIYVVDNNGDSVLHHAAIGNSFEILYFLLSNEKFSFNIKQKNKNGETFLFLLLKSKEIITNDVNLEKIKYFLNYGSSLLTKNNNNENILEIIAKKNYSQFGYLNLLELGEISIKRDIMAKNSINILQQFTDGLKLFISYFLLNNNEFSNYLEYYLIRDKNELGMDFLNGAKIEIIKLKTIIILDNYSYYDFLTIDLLKCCHIVKQLKLMQKLFITYQRKCEFFYYELFIAKRFSDINSVIKFFPSIINFLLNYSDYKLPLLIVEKIFNYLSPKDVRLFGKILTKKL